MYNYEQVLYEKVWISVSGTNKTMYIKKYIV